jgi:hypothetical protein
MAMVLARAPDPKSLKHESRRQVGNMATRLLDFSLHKLLYRIIKDLEYTLGKNTQTKLHITNSGTFPYPYS